MNAGRPPLDGNESAMTKAAKDRPWWINPGYDAQENVELDALNASPAGSYELLESG